jgi:hypothetical protein
MSGFVIFEYVLSPHANQAAGDAMLKTMYAGPYLVRPDNCIAVNNSSNVVL